MEWVMSVLGELNGVGDVNGLGDRTGVGTCDKLEGLDCGAEAYFGKILSQLENNATPNDPITVMMVSKTVTLGC
jgi:hypothetical protein